MAALGLSPEEIAAVDKMADYKVRNGDAFEALIKQKQQGNPKFAFLFDIASPAHAYYQQRYHQLKTQQAAAAATATQPHPATLQSPGVYGAPSTLGGPSHFNGAGGLLPQGMPQPTHPPGQMQQLAHMQQMQMAHMQQQMQMMQAQQVQQSQQVPPSAAPPLGMAMAPSSSPEELARERAAALAQRLQPLAASTLTPTAPWMCANPSGAPITAPSLAASAVPPQPPMPPAFGAAPLAGSIPPIAPMCTMNNGVASFSPISPNFSATQPAATPPAVLSAHTIPVGALATLLAEREQRRGGSALDHKFEPLQHSEMPRTLPSCEPPSAEVLKAVEEFYGGGKPPRRSRPRPRERRSPSPSYRRDSRSCAVHGSERVSGYERTSAHAAQEDMGIREDGSAFGGSCGGHVGLGAHSKLNTLSDQFAEFRGRRSNDYKESMAISKANQYNNWYNV